MVVSQVFLSRRNLLVLLSKLNRVKQGEASHCTILKRDTTHPTYPASVPTAVTAVEDADYYNDGHPAGEMHPDDVPSSPIDIPVKPFYPTGADTREGIA